MSSANAGEPPHKNLGMWVTIILEGLMIIAVGLYNIYEIRKNSDLVQQKLEGLSQYTARQGQKVDRMMTALELYVGKKFDALNAATNTTAEQKIERAAEFFEAWKKRDKRVQSNALNGIQPATPETDRLPELRSGP